MTKLHDDAVYLFLSSSYDWLNILRRVKTVEQKQLNKNCPKCFELESLHLLGRVGNKLFMTNNFATKWLQKTFSILCHCQSSLWDNIDYTPSLLEKFLPTPMGVLATGSGHARPSARPPIYMSGKFPTHISGGLKMHPPPK